MKQDDVPLDQEPVYFVTDIETDGPDPGIHSMISLASVACDARGVRLGCLALNLDPIEGHVADSGTMAWWASEPTAWHATLQARLPPAEAMRRFVTWVRGFAGLPVFAGYPMIFDGV